MELTGVFVLALAFAAIFIAGAWAKRLPKRQPDALDDEWARSIK